MYSRKEKNNMRTLKEKETILKDMLVVVLVSELQARNMMYPKVCYGDE